MSIESNRWAFLVSYLGKSYCGWQRQIQKNYVSNEVPVERRSVQWEFERALQAINGSPTLATASGRTDSGVNALGQVVHADLKGRWSGSKLVLAINAHLPMNIRVINAVLTRPHFHARKDAAKKQYSYYFLSGRTDIPFYRHRAHWVPFSLDIESMDQAAQALVGSHDFVAFRGRGGKTMESTIRAVFEAQVSILSPCFPPLASHRLIRFRVVGSGFLKQMVRSIAGTLLEIGQGRRVKHSIKDLIHTQNRLNVGKTAPPEGLWLEKVWYPDIDLGV